MDNNTIFSSFKLRDFKLKNRIGLAPMTRMSSPGDSIPRKDVLDLLVNRAKNGAAIVYTEAIVTDYESAQGYPGQARLTTQSQIDAWASVVNKIHKEGAIAIMQMFHCGRIGWPEVNPAKRIIAPSAITPRQDNPLTQSPFPVPDAMSVFDIQHVIQGFVETAKGAVAAGFDGIEIHGAHGYLINQFLSAYSNQRSDAFGGSVENRYRFAHEIIQAVSEAIPKDRLLLFRISNWGVVDMEVSLFENSSEYQQIITFLSKEPLDAISVSTYDCSEKAFNTDQSMAQITRQATHLPIIICGKVYDRASCQDALMDADIVLSAKSMLLNPNWVEDVRSGKTLPIHKSQEADIAYTEKVLP